jgi:O-antigen/teichoic acid export membrane protein
VPVEDERRRIARNAASAYGTRALVGLSALLLTPYLYRRLGGAAFGTWSVIFTLMMVAELIETGFSAGVIKLVSELRGQRRRADLERSAGFAVVLFAAVGVGAALLLAGAGWGLDGLAAAGVRADFRHGLLVLAGAVLVRYPCVAYLATLKGYQRYDLANASDAVYITVFTVGAVVAVESGLGVFGVALAYAAGAVAAGLLGLFMLARVDPQLPLRPRSTVSAERRRMVDTSSFALLAESMIFIGQRMDVLVIAAVRNAVTAAPYAAALKLQSAVQALTLPFVRLLMPMASELWAEGRRDEVARRVTVATRVALQATLPVALAFALFAHDIVRIWLGRGAPAVTATIIVVLMAVQTMTLSAAPAETILVGIGRVRVIGLLSLVEGLANIALTIGLVAAYGAIGAALGTLLTSAVLAPVKYPLVCRSLGCAIGEFLRGSLGAALLSSLPAAAAMALVRLTLPQGLLRFGVGTAVGVALALAVAVAQVGLGRAVGLVRARAGDAEAASSASLSQVGSDFPIESAG